MTAENQNQQADPSADQAVDEAITDPAVGSTKVVQLEAELQDANDRTLRVQAELENYRKRVQREMADERKFAVIPLVRDLLPVVDNLERAIVAAQQSSSAEGLLDGVKMVAGQLTSALAQHQCVRVEDEGSLFDPNVHQAIGQEPSDNYPAGTVSRSFQAGYKLHDRVIRPAQVFVSTGPASPSGG